MGKARSPLVSVIVPVYNTEQYLEACIQSLLNQTLEDIELIFVDDMSTDSSLEILKKYEDEYRNRIRVYQMPVKGLQGGARNYGIKMATGKYIGFCDSDDIAHPRLYECLYLNIKNTQADLACVQYTMVPEDTELNDVVDNSACKPFLKWTENLLRLNARLLSDEMVCDLIAFDKGPICTWLCKKEIILENSINFPQLKYEDNYFSTLYSAYVKKIVLIDEVLYFYRIRKGSTVTSRNQNYQIKDRIKIENKLQEEAKIRGLYSKYYEAWEYIYAYRYAINTISKVYETFDDIPYSEIQAIANSLKLTYPNWKKNKYWRMRTNVIGSAIGWLFINYPRIAHCLYKVHLIK
jgi:glycosyltransferase involved in cell wall biosynthesis